MSAIDVESLKSVNDDKIPSEFFQDDIIAGTDTKFDSLFRFSKLIQHGRIINNDAVNEITFQVGSNQGVIQRVPPKSDESFDGWFSKLLIFPNGASGILELDLVNTKDARK